MATVAQRERERERRAAVYQAPVKITTPTNMLISANFIVRPLETASARVCSLTFAGAHIVATKGHRGGNFAGLCGTHSAMVAARW